MAIKKEPANDQDGEAKPGRHQKHHPIFAAGTMISTNPTVPVNTISLVPLRPKKKKC